MGQLLATELAPFLLELARITGLVVVGVVPFEGAPKQAKAAAVIVLAMAAHGVAPSQASLLDPLQAAAHVFTEFLVGVAIGFVVRMALAAAEVAGTTIAPMMGFGAAQVFDPGTGQQDSVLTRGFRLFAGLVAIAVGLHRVMLAALLASFRQLPVGSAIDVVASVEGVLLLSADVISAGVLLALPVVAALLMVQLALAFVARAAPSMQIFNIGFTVFLGVGGALLWLTIPDTGRELAVRFSRVGFQLEAVMLSMIPG